MAEFEKVSIHCKEAHLFIFMFFMCHVVRECRGGSSGPDENRRCRVPFGLGRRGRTWSKVF